MWGKTVILAGACALASCASLEDRAKEQAVEYGMRGREAYIRGNAASMVGDYKALDDFNEAILHSTKSIEAFPTAPAYWNRAQAQYGKGVMLAAQSAQRREEPDMSCFEKAITDLNESLKFNPRQPDAYALIGFTNQLMKRNELARENYQQALNLLRKGVAMRGELFSEDHIEMLLQRLPQERKYY